jgi:hypothetical protein
VLVLASVALNVTGTLMHHANPTLFTVVLRTVGEVLARGVLGWVVAVAVFDARKITHYRIQNAIVLYLDFA